MLVVAAILFAVNVFNHKLLTVEAFAAMAVLLTFGHAQIADRLAEQEGKRAIPSVDCYKKLWYYFIGKELLWSLYFLETHAYSALVGVVVFLVYPFWRKLYRKGK